MPSTVEKLGPSRVKLTIEIPFADLTPHLDKSYREIASQVNIPGFRKGKVPPAVIDQRFGRGMVLQEAINAALPDAYAAAVAEAALVPLSDPEVEVTKLEDRELVEFTAEVDVRPEFDLPDFSTLSAEVPVLEPVGDAVEERLQMMRQRFATREDVDRAAAEGDVVTLDLAGSSDGEPLADATAEGITYKVGSGGMLEGLDEAISGLSAGESADFSSTLVGGPLKDEAADIHVTVQKVQTETLPEVDDEFAQMVSEFDTADEMRADLTNAVEQMAKVDQINAARDKVLEDLVEKVDFEVPAGLLQAELDARRDQITEQLAQAGMTLDSYLEQTEEEEANTAEEFWQILEGRVAQSLKAQIILDKLADDRELGVDQQELTEMLFRRAAANNSSPEQEMQHMMEHNHTSQWMQDIRRDKALRLILDGASVKDTDGNAVVANPQPAADDEESAQQAPAAEEAPKKKAPAKKAATKAKADEAVESEESAEG